jgi:multicomponent K+:H+ antiporter subunit G
MNSSSPFWIDAFTAGLVVIGALAALIGSFGLLRFRSFFQRVHTPTLGATVGTWAFTAATMSQVSFAAGQPYVHVLLIAVLMALTAPVTTTFLMRAALFRARARREADVPILRINEPAVGADSRSR